MRLELKTQGYDVQIIAVNGQSADNDKDQGKLIDRCAFPLFQDTTDTAAWSMFGGGKDDMYIYRADGTLSVYLEYGENVVTKLSSTEGYDNVLSAILAAHDPD